ncbi:hypothetical protein ACFXAW_02635 [Streptomyces sp. NPDC059445]|uniref:hypothetical protein n=1 Tax=unclassified Streptomyces TaxID=2593676 RepID=UPI0036CFA5F8
MERPTSDTTSSKADDEAVLRDVLERWKSAVTDRPPLPVFLAVLAVATPDGNGVALYQVSKLD